MSARLQLKQQGEALEVVAALPKGTGEIEVRLYSGRNRPISKASDVSSLARQSHVGPSAKDSHYRNRDVWFPVVDLFLEPGMEAVAVFEEPDPRQQGTVVVNGPFHPEIRPLARQIVLPIDQLEFWENWIFVKDSASRLEQFYLRQRFAVQETEFNHTYQLLSKQWDGEVSVGVVGKDGFTELARASTQRPDLPPPEGLRGRGLEPERVLDSLKATVACILRRQNECPWSGTFGGLYLFYDLDARLFRDPVWIWAYGPSIKVLLDAAKMPDVASGFGSERLREAAAGIGEASLRLLVRDEEHPANGLVITRWDPGTQHSEGYEGFISPPDGLFLAGWAWIPLYEALADERYLEATETMARATERLIHEYGKDIVPQDYLMNEGKWKGWIVNEAGFGMEGLAELYRVTGDERYRRIGQQYMDQLLVKFDRDDGLWEKLWWPDTGDTTPCERMTRSLAWAMEGLLAAHRIVPDGRYLERSRRLAEHLVQTQLDSGCWSFIFNRPVEEVGISEKGTAAWSLLFYRLYRATGEERYLATARKALAWLIDNQYLGPDVDAYGSVPGSSPHSGVVYRPYFRLSCTYTSGFFGLAALEELKLAAG